MTTTRKELVERNRNLNSKLSSLKTAHGAAQRVGADNRTGSPGCGLSKAQIQERCAALRAEMDTVRAERDLVRAAIEALPAK